MRVVILAPPGVQSLDVVGPAEVFGEASRRLSRSDSYDVVVMGTVPGPITGTAGLRFLPDRTIFDPDEAIDTLLVGGNPTLPPPSHDAVAWLARRAVGARRYGSICTGVFLLAAAGLLEGKRVTTHWDCASALATAYPNVQVDADRIFTRDGALCTAAGVSAGMDLALALVEEDHGRDLALAVARYMVMFLKRPGGQSQFSPHLAAQMSEKSSIQRVQEHVLRSLEGDLSVEALSGLANMSVRNFSRVFAKEVGLTPAAFVELARIETARRLLEDTITPLQRLASTCGFNSVDSMRRAFIRSVGVDPLGYRHRFRSALPERSELAVH